MRPANEFVQEFMEKLKNNDFQKDYLTNDGPELSDEFIKESVEGFQGLLNMDV